MHHQALCIISSPYVKRLSGVMTSVTLTFDLWPWPLAWTGRQTDKQTDRRTERSVLRAAWSQLKTPCYGYRNPHNKHKTVWRPSQVNTGNPYTNKTVSSRWMEGLQRWVKLPTFSERDSRPDDRDSDRVELTGRKWARARGQAQFWLRLPEPKTCRVTCAPTGRFQEAPTIRNLTLQGHGPFNCRCDLDEIHSSVARGKYEDHEVCD